MFIVFMFVWNCLSFWCRYTVLVLVKVKTVRFDIIQMI